MVGIIEAVDYQDFLGFALVFFWFFFLSLKVTYRKGNRQGGKEEMLIDCTYTGCTMHKMFR